MLAEGHRRQIKRMIRNARIHMDAAFIAPRMIVIAIMRRLRILAAHPHVVVRGPRGLKRS